MKNISKLIITVCACSMLVFTSCSDKNTNAQNQNNESITNTNAQSQTNENIADTNEVEPYTDEELCQMALNYYQKKTGEDISNLLSASETLENGEVVIQLYTNLGDHNSTAAWYTVDRSTAIGTNSLGEEIDLKDNK